MARTKNKLVRRGRPPKKFNVPVKKATRTSAKSVVAEQFKELRTTLEALQAYLIDDIKKDIQVNPAEAAPVTDIAPQMVSLLEATRTLNSSLTLALKGLQHIVQFHKATMIDSFRQYANTAVKNDLPVDLAEYENTFKHTLAVLGISSQELAQYNPYREEAPHVNENLPTPEAPVSNGLSTLSVL